MGTAFGNVRHDAVNLKANLTPKLAPKPTETWPLQMVDYTRKGQAGIAVAPRSEPWRLAPYSGPGQPKPGRLQPF